ncbi:MAG TPA: EthD family reductase, partial [Phototrophicaceae bacterium]|nr:EthD family reductase [Phototrophicaceae bacterium]
SILYPDRKGSRFDMDYYLNKHMPLSIDLLSAHPGFKGVSVEHGVGGGAPDAPPTYLIMCHFLFDSIESFMAAFVPNRPILQGDRPNYTDVEPIVQMSEVVISR